MFGRSNPSVENAMLAVQGTYREALRVRRDVENCVHMYDNLRAETTVVDLDGVTKQLLCLKGTIPIAFENEVYNFPIEIILPDSYPFKPPFFRLTPTGRLRIKPQHRHVDDSGRVYNPYLTSWNAAQSNLAELVVQIALEFGKDPPLYEIPDVPPPVPASMNRPPPPPISHNSSNGFLGPPPVYRSTPPPPPISSVPKPPIASNGAKSSVPPPPISSVSSSSSTLQPSVSVLKMRLTDKLKLRCANTLPSIQKNLQTQLELAEKLDSSGLEMNTRLQQMKKVERDLQQQLDDVALKRATLESWLEERSAQLQQMQAKLDDYVVPSDGETNQLMTLVSETLAMDDVLYQLNNALMRQKIDLKTFLKQVRAVAREQFLKQALAMKIYSMQTNPELNAPSSPALRPKPAGHGSASGHYSSMSNPVPSYPPY